MSGSPNIVSWVGGYDLTGVGSLTNVTDDHTLLQEEINLIGPRGIFKHKASIGKNEYTFSEEGYMDETQVGIRRLLSQPGTPWASILCKLGYEVGLDCTIADKIAMGKYSIPTSNESLTRVSVEYHLDKDGVVYPDSRVLADGSRKTVAGTNRAVDMGSSSPNGIIMCVMVDGVVFDAADHLTVNLQHSANGRSGWVDASAATNFTPPDTPQTFLHTVPSIVRRYVRLQYAWNDTTEDNRSAKIMAAISKL